MSITAVPFVSDHGFRFNSLRKKIQGWHEDMLPYCFVHMPDRFSNEHRDAMRNSKLLVTVYDLRDSPRSSRSLEREWDHAER